MRVHTAPERSRRRTHRDAPQFSIFFASNEHFLRPADDKRRRAISSAAHTRGATHKQSVPLAHTRAAPRLMHRFIAALGGTCDTRKCAMQREKVEHGAPVGGGYRSHGARSIHRRLCIRKRGTLVSHTRRAKLNEIKNVRVLRRAIL